MSSSVAELVDAIAAISLADEVDDLARLEQALAERQRLLSMLQNADTSELSTEDRTALDERLRAAFAQDAEVLEYLHALREDTIKSLEGLSSGRAAVRGYGETLGANVSPSRRIG